MPGNDVIALDRQEVQKLAYSLWEKEGRPQGAHLKHYYEAERIVRERMASEAMKADAARKLATKPAAAPVPPAAPPPSSQPRTRRMTRG